MKTLTLSTWLILLFTLLTTGCTSKTVTYFNNITLLDNPKKSVKNPILQEIAEHLQSETNATLLYPGDAPHDEPHKLTLFLTDKYLKISFNDLKMFNPGQTVLSESVKEDLGHITPILKHYPHIIIQIIGHAYEEGKEKEIRHYADMRAISVAEYLYDQGFKQEILAKGCDDDVPRQRCSKDKPHLLCSSKNRRIEIFVYSDKADVITRCR